MNGWVDFSPEARLAWAIGLFEGEGTITLSGGRPRLALKMTDSTPVYRFHRTVGYGKLYGPYQNRCKDGRARKPYVYWVASADDACAVAEILGPFLSPRRRDQIAAMLAAPSPSRRRRCKAAGASSRPGRGSR